MATLYSDIPVGSGRATYPVTEYGGGVVNAAWGGYSFTADPAPADVLYLFYLPACKVLDGAVRGVRLDTDASATFDFDIGVPADTDAFGNFGVVGGAAVSGVKPEAQIWMPLNGLLKNGPYALTEKTPVILTVNDDTATFAAGAVWVHMFYACGK